MKLLLQFILAIMAVATVLAAPMDKAQVPMGGKHDHALANATPQSTDFKTPFVVKVHSPTPPPASPMSAPKPAAKESKPGRAPSWLMRWRAQEGATNRSRREPPPSCFCAGGSVCCHTLKGLDCNVGLCGI